MWWGLKMIKPIHNESDYKIALEQVERLWESEQYTPDGDELDALLALIEEYENKHHQMPQSDSKEIL